MWSLRFAEGRTRPRSLRQGFALRQLRPELAGDQRMLLQVVVLAPVAVAVVVVQERDRVAGVRDRRETVLLALGVIDPAVCENERALALHVVLEMLDPGGRDGVAAAVDPDRRPGRFVALARMRVDLLQEELHEHHVGALVGAARPDGGVE